VINAKSINKLANIERESRKTAGWQICRHCHSERIKVGGKGEWMRREQRTEGEMNEIEMIWYLRKVATQQVPMPINKEAIRRRNKPKQQ
jgi:hypothetical protein